MTTFLTLLARIVSLPVVSKVLMPAISRALEDFFTGQIQNLEWDLVVRAAKTAKTKEELRVASEKLSKRVNHNSARD